MALCRGIIVSLDSKAATGRFAGAHHQQFKVATGGKSLTQFPFVDGGDRKPKSGAAFFSGMWFLGRQLLKVSANHDMAPISIYWPCRRNLGAAGLQGLLHVKPPTISSDLRISINEYLGFCLNYVFGLH